MKKEKWIVVVKSGWRCPPPFFYLRRVRSSIGRMKYLADTLVERRSDASKFSTREAAELAEGWLGNSMSYVERA